MGRNASQVAKEEGHEIVSEELRKGKPKGKIRHRNVFQHFAVSVSIIKLWYNVNKYILGCSVQDRMEGATDFLLAPGLKLAYRATKVSATDDVSFDPQELFMHCCNYIGYTLLYRAS